MLVDISKIIVGDRIRKDFGDIQELAEDIRTNGLINPPTINKEYRLLAGERRLRACKMLGWPQIPVNMLDTKDEAHDLAVEMSENNMRRNFTGSELADGIRRQMAIESEKARERQQTTQFGSDGTGNISLTAGRARDKAGEAFGISGKQAEKVVFVDEHRDLLDPADFAEWDEGKLSTNKAFQRIKAAMAQAEKERDEARVLAEKTKNTQMAALKQRDQMVKDLRKASVVTTNLEMEVESLRQQLSQKSEPEVIEREVESQESKRRIAELERLEHIHQEDNQKLRRQLESTRKELDKAKDIIGMDKTLQNVRRDVQYLITSTNQYVRQYGGLTWTVQSLSEVDAQTLEELTKAVRNLATFANTLMNCLEAING